jgi:hypothetical protein
LLIRDEHRCRGGVDRPPENPSLHLLMRELRQRTRLGWPVAFAVQPRR